MSICLFDHPLTFSYNTLMKPQYRKVTPVRQQYLEIKSKYPTQYYFFDWVIFMKRSMMMQKLQLAI